MLAAFAEQERGARGRKHADAAPPANPWNGELRHPQGASGHLHDRVERRRQVARAVLHDVQRLAAGLAEIGDIAADLDTPVSAYLKLAPKGLGPLGGRTHFFALAAKCIRQIIIDHARQRGAKKRGGDAIKLELTPELAADTSTKDPVDLLALDPLNPQTAARFVPSLGRCRRDEPGRAAIMRAEAGRDPHDRGLQDLVGEGLKPLYNYLTDLPDMTGAPTPILPADRPSRAWPPCRCTIQPMSPGRCGRRE